MLHNPRMCHSSKLCPLQLKPHGLSSLLVHQAKPATASVHFLFFHLPGSVWHRSGDFRETLLNLAPWEAAEKGNAFLQACCALFFHHTEEPHLAAWHASPIEWPMLWLPRWAMFPLYKPFFLAYQV